jgi:hypothetical protein
MKDNYAEVIFCTRSPVDRRKVKDRRSFLKQEDLSHKPERRVSMIDRRMNGDRRQIFPEIMKAFWKEAP